ncbi:MAG TPA: methyltransferase, partial [Naasia sp.]
MDEAELIERLRADLVAAGYTASAVSAVWGPAAEAALARGTLLPAVRASSGARTPAALLARLFMLG